MKNKLLFFDTMITPKIITFIYWFLLLLVTGYGLKTMFGGYEFTFSNFMMGIVYILFGAVLVRVWCELMIVIFKINDNLQNLKEK